MIRSLIWAMARNRVIGRNNSLPWRLPKDMAHFMATTLGKPVVMGRRTFESMKAPLSGRTNIVITTDAAYARQGIRVAHSLNEAFEIADAQCALDGVSEQFVIGGAGVYEESLPHADRLYVTRIHADVEGDTYFPEVNWAEWREVDRVDHDADDAHAYAFSISTFERA